MRMTFRGWALALSTLGVLAAVRLIGPAPAPPASPPATSVLAAPDAQAWRKLWLSWHLVEHWQVELRLAMDIVHWVHEQAERYDLAPTLLLAMMAQESAFRPQAVSPAGAVGLMQVMPRWHDQRRHQLGLTQPLQHPYTSIAVGAHILHEYLQRSGGDLKAALARYSGGATGYAQRVFALQRRFEAVAQQAPFD